MRKTLGIAVFMLALCCPALAGEIHIPPVAPDPPQANTAQEPTGDETANGDMQNDATDSLTQIALELLTSVLP